MDYNPHPRQSRCKLGKVCFGKRTAATKRNFLQHRGNTKRLQIYQCTLCNVWHLTKKVHIRPRKHKRRSIKEKPELAAKRKLAGLSSANWRR